MVAVCTVGYLHQTQEPTLGGFEPSRDADQGAVGICREMMVAVLGGDGAVVVAEEVS